jgi:hypothetical protein
VLVVLALRTAHADAGDLVLERYPVCEASSAIAIPCAHDEARGCAWIADNEQDAHLFAYALEEDGRLAPAAGWRVPLGEARVADVEALAGDGGDVLAFGSHGRGRDCRRRPRRAAVARLRLDGSHAELAASGESWPEALARCATSLIALSPDDPARGLRDAVCAAIDAAERAADRAAAGTGTCRGDAFDVEGAVAVPEADGPSRVWLGLRAPLVEERAVLLRLVPGIVHDGTLAFDGVATIGLGGRGIRELAFADGYVWGIAGDVTDGERPSRLWRIPASELRSGAVIAAAETVAEGLPPGAEGLLVQGARRRAVVVVDGRTDEKRERCAVDAAQLVVTLP